ncbi:MAG: PIN domain-containing protein [Candidatus Diapherotrites archaeon]
MQKRFYVDTSVWLDYYGDRKDGIRPLGEFAFKFFKHCNENNCKVFFSDFVLFELKEFFPEKEIKILFSVIKKNLLMKVSVSEKQLMEANKIKKVFKEIPLNDIIHAIMARDSNAVLISRDKHFEDLSAIVECRPPEEII